ncbi:MAG: hypothetical protein C0407_02235, partial [Desulfobacca sp.]|nr:hypothetical protein [Desulfobacca sp.]
MLDLRGVNASYGTIQALKNISIKVGIGDIVSIIGANGAGKTSLLKTISGVMELKLPVPRCAGRLPAPWCRESSRQRKSFSCCSSLANPRGKLREMRSPSLFKSGAIWYQGINLLQCAPVKIVAMGISQVPEGRQLFSRLTVLDNLYLGAYLYDNRKFKTEIKEQLDWIYSLFPVLKKQAKQLAGTIHAG